MLRLADYQMGGVARRGFATGQCDGLVRVRQVSGVVAFFVDDPADHRHAQRAVGAGADRNPVATFAAGQVVGVGQHRVDHHVIQLAAGAGLGQQGALTLERVAGIARRRADEDDEFGVGKIGLGVRHGFQVAEHGTGAGAVGAAAVRAVADKVERAVGLLPETAGERLAPVVDAAPYRHLVDPGPQLRSSRVDRLEAA